MAVSRQGCKEGRRWRLHSLHPCLLTAMGGQGDSREGSLTSCNHPIAGSHLSMHQYTYINLNLLFYKSKFVYLHRIKTI